MNRFFLQIFNTAITAGWLVLAVLLARLLLKKAPAWIKCALWAIVGLRLVWPFEIESVLSAVPSTQTIPPAALYDPVPEVHAGINYLNSAINPGFAQTFQPVPSASVNPLQVATTVAAWVWIAGIIAMLAYMAYSYLRLRRLVVVRMSAGEGVYLCDRVDSPFILGIVRPKIYLPSQLSQEKWADILAHEQAHIARRDHWWKPLGFLLLTVFWFHPLLWLAYILLCRDVELACDEKVIRGLSPEEKQRYSQTLLECSMPRKWITACPLAFGEVGVKERVKNVLNYKKPSFWIILIALIVCTVVAVCFLTDPLEKWNGHDNSTAADVAGKQYVYTKDGAGSDFYINIYRNGTFQYYAGVYSSHIGLGTWEVRSGKLYLNDTTLQNPMIFVFSITDNALVYIADESYPFMYVDVNNGDRFCYYADLSLSDEARNVPGPAEVWKMIHNVIGLETGEFQLSAFPEHNFRWGDGKIEIVHKGKAAALVENAAIYYLGAVDLNFDNCPEICASVGTEKEGEYVIIYDVANDKTHVMRDPDGAYVYYLYHDYEDGHYYVMCAKDDAKTGKAVEAGRLYFADRKTPAILAPTLGSLSNDSVTVLFDREHPDSAHQGQTELEGFPGVSIRWYYTPNIYGNEWPVLVNNGTETTLFEGYPAPCTLYITDVTGDGKPDLCADVYYFFSGLPSYNAVCVYDYANDRYYILEDRENMSHATKCSYYLRMDNGQLVCDKVTVAEGSVLVTGPLYLEQDGEETRLCMRLLYAYDSPVHYTYSGDHILDRVVLTVTHEGNCSMRFSCSPQSGNRASGILMGTYFKDGDMLTFYTEELDCYVFRFEGENLVFVKNQSSKLPEGCILYNGAVLEPRVVHD